MSSDQKASQKANSRHVIRLDFSGTHGWQLRIPSWHPQGPKTIYYSDLKHGGPDGAWDAAIRERDRIFASVSLPVAPQHRSAAGRPNRANQSHISGVYLSYIRRPTGSICWFWVAVWPNGGRASFSVSRFGFDKAFEEAFFTRLANAPAAVPDSAVGQALAYGRRRIRTETEWLKKATKTENQGAKPNPVKSIGETADH